jgi:DNA-binding NarL/FixJ family response regulator
MWPGRLARDPFSSFVACGSTWSIPVVKAAIRRDMVKILLADDHVIVCDALANMLGADPRFDVVGQAHDGLETLKKVEELHPDLVVIDIGMPGLNGIEVIKRIKKKNPRTKAIVLSMHKDEAYIYWALRVGASGYVIKQSAARELVDAIAQVQLGNTYLSPSISNMVIKGFLQGPQTTDPESDPLTLLTDREREILQLVAEGLTSKEIAQRLDVSIRTIDAHRANIMNKLNIHTTPGLVKFAIRNRLTSWEE